MGIALSREHARRFLLTHQGLDAPDLRDPQTAIPPLVRRLGCIQFDPLDQVGPNHELVLQARIARFRSHQLFQALYHHRSLLEGWDKNMALYAREDWPFFARRRHRERRKLEPLVASALPRVREALALRSPLGSGDLDLNEKVDWPWGPTRMARAALESMFLWGELVIHHRVGSRKLYAPARDHLPGALLDAPDPYPEDDAHAEAAYRRRLRGMGLVRHRAGDPWLGMESFRAPGRNRALEGLRRRGVVDEVRVEGLPEPLFMATEDLPTLERRTAPPARAALLAPLDNLLWDRTLIQALFDFDYRWEVYKPRDERRFGYYVLPVLFQDRFVARCEPVRDRKRKILELRNWWWEPGVRRSAEMDRALVSCFEAFLGFVGATALVLAEDARRALGSPLSRKLLQAAPPAESP